MGDMPMIREIASGFDWYAAQLHLLESKRVMSRDEELELLKMRGIIKDA